MIHRKLVSEDLKDGLLGHRIEVRLDLAAVILPTGTTRSYSKEQGVTRARSYAIYPAHFYSCTTGRQNEQGQIRASTKQ